jgi:disulfide bond formation protein DsbB
MSVSRPAQTWPGLSELWPWFALVVATVATAGSLYFSEVLKWTPCLFCWYQRGFMYPQVILFVFAIYLRARRVFLLSIPMSLIGLGIAIYHQIAIHRPDLIPPTPCANNGGPPCTFDYLQPWIMGWTNGRVEIITIPFLAMLAFILILIAMIAFARSDGWRAAPAASPEA